MNVFVTGATSVVGMAIVKALVDRDHKVTVLEPREVTTSPFNQLNIAVKKGGLDTTREWLEHAISHDAFIHLSSCLIGSEPESDNKIIQGLAELTPRRGKPLRFVYTGGCWLYPSSNVATPITETTRFDPSKKYGWVGGHIRSLQYNNSISLTIVHPAHVCSNNQGVVQEMVMAARNGDTFKTTAKATTCWPLVEVNDLAELYCLILDASRYRLVVNASGIPGVAVGELATTVSALTRTELNVSTGETGPAQQEANFEQLINDFEKDQVMVSDQAHRILKWRPKYDNVEALVNLALSST